MYKRFAIVTTLIILSLGVIAAKPVSMSSPDPLHLDNYLTVGSDPYTGVYPGQVSLGDATDEKLALGYAFGLIISDTSTAAAPRATLDTFGLTFREPNGDLRFKVDVSAASLVVMLPFLPTSDPSNPGQLWNDAGTLKVSQ